MSTLVNEYRLDVSEDGTKATCYFPGISYDDFDRAGGICPWKICRMFEAGRIISYTQGNFIEFNKLKDKNHAFFLLGGNYYFDSCLWEVPQRNQYFPFKIQSELIDVGQTSITLHQILINLFDNKEVATFYGKFVYVDASSRRSIALPYWFRVKNRMAESSEKVRIHTTINSVPENSFMRQSVISASDTDFNGHTNQSSYIRFCLDSAASATSSKYFKRLTNDICLYPILKMSVAYHNETLSGDGLVTSVWQDDLSHTSLSFSIARDKQVVFTSTMTFKERQTSKLQASKL